MMKYILTNKINTIRYFTIHFGYLFCIKKEKIEVLDESFKCIYTEFVEEDLQELHSGNGYVWTNTSELGLGLLYDSNRFVKKSYLIKDIDKKGNVFCRFENKGTKLNKAEKIIWQIEDKFFSYVVTDDIFFYKSNKIYLKALDNSNGKSIWQYTLPEGKYDVQTRFNGLKKGEISKVIGVYKDVVWVSLNFGTLLGLDVNSGELKYEVLNQDAIIKKGLYTQLDTENGVLFGLRNTLYWEIDLNQSDMIFHDFDIAETCTKNNIRAEMPVYDWSWEGDEIFFGEIYDADRNKETNTIGIFNRKSKEISWSARIGEKGDTQPILQKIEYSTNRLYVLDGQSTLHILERE